MKEEINLLFNKFVSTMYVCTYVLKISSHKVVLGFWIDTHKVTGTERHQSHAVREVKELEVSLPTRLQLLINTFLSCLLQRQRNKPVKEYVILAFEFGGHKNCTNLLM